MLTRKHQWFLGSLLFPHHSICESGACSPGRRQTLQSGPVHLPRVTDFTRGLPGKWGISDSRVCALWLSIKLKV